MASKVFNLIICSKERACFYITVYYICTIYNRFISSCFDFQKTTGRNIFSNNSRFNQCRLAKYIILPHTLWAFQVELGVRIYDLERYITARHKDVEILQLTLERWTIEIYRTIIETLQSIAWMYLIVFIFALIAYVIVRGFELKNANKQ